MDFAKETKRILIGWPGANGAQLLVGGQQNFIKQEHIDKTTAAIQTVNSRINYANPTNVISEPATELTEYINQFWTQPNIEIFVQEGWKVKIADLKKVITVQPTVESISSKERANGLEPNDTLGLAKFTLPINPPTNLLVAFDQIKNAWIFSSPNPNLRVIGNFAQGNLFGFAAGISNSFVQVVKCQGRYFMRDGHHRAYGLLTKNIHIVPVLYREYNSFNEMGIPPGLFPIDTLISDKPPMITDYFDDTVSGTADFPKSTKVIVIQALEVNPIT